MDDNTISSVSQNQHNSNTIVTEPLLIKDEARYVMFPIKYNDVWNMYKKQMDSFWRCEEINMSKDLAEWEKMNDDEKYFIKMVLAFFAASDGIVLENLAQRFMSDIENSEIRAFYSMQIFMENIHCVSGNTRIMTNKGYEKISDIVNKSTSVWNGTEFSDVTIKYTGNQALFRVYLSNGMYLDCTDGHKWLIYEKSGKIMKVTTNELIPFVTKLVEFDYPIMDFLNDDDSEYIFDNPYNRGKEIGSWVMDNNKYPHINNPIVPINYSIEIKFQWLLGFFKNGAYICSPSQYGDYIIIYSIQNSFLIELQLMFSTIGIHAHICNESLNIKKYISSDDIENNENIKNNENNSYNYIVINDSQFNKLENIGIKPLDIIKKQIQFVDINTLIEVSPNIPKHIHIIDICKISDDSPTYCFNEPIKHLGIFNGILTGQSEMYSILIDTYSKNKVEKDNLFNAIKHFPCIQKKANWARRWINDKDATFATRLIAFAIVEGIFFSSSFASIYWVKKRGMLQGLTLSNEFISRDEALHVEFAVLLYHKLINKLDNKTFYQIMEEAIAIEKEFILEAIPCRLIGMNAGLMSQYIEFVGNRLCLQLGYDKLFPLATNPFDFMELISLNDKVNFFEKTNTQYALANKVMEGDPFDLTSDF